MMNEPKYLDEVEFPVETLAAAALDGYKTGWRLGWDYYFRLPTGAVPPMWEALHYATSIDLKDFGKGDYPTVCNYESELEHRFAGGVNRGIVDGYKAARETEGNRRRWEDFEREKAPFSEGKHL